MRPLVGLLPLVAIAVIGPLASASPSDGTWMAGFYDAADYDDVIDVVFAMTSASPVFVGIATFVALVLGVVAVSYRELLPALARPIRRGRAPPTIAPSRRH